MDHNLTLITTIAAGFGGALVLGFLAEKLRLPALVGYLLAGILIGPATPGFVADVHIASQLSEIGVMLLMFGVGLHFSLGDLLSVRRLAVPGAVVQMSVATLLGMGLAWWMGWGVGSGLIFGLSLSCASTVVLLKALEARGVLDSMNGRIAVGWLVVEDLACVLVLVLMPPLAGLIGGGAAPPPSKPASGGISTSTSTQARSSTTSQPTAMRPFIESSTPRASRALSSTTVLAHESDSPKIKPLPTPQPIHHASPMPSRVATLICTTAPGTASRRTESRSPSEKCSPTPNISSITPISDSCEAMCTSATKPGVAGPIRMPASR